MARRKQAALAVPASTEEALQLIAEYVEAERAMLAGRLTAEVKIDAIKAERDECIGKIAAANEQRFLGLKAWWEAVGHELAKGRSAELAGARLGIRLTPPKVKLARGVKVEAVIAWLKQLRWARKAEFLRAKVELDKPAVIKAVQAEEDVRTRFADAGVTVVQDDEFFIDCGLDEDALRKQIAAPA